MISRGRCYAISIILALLSPVLLLGGCASPAPLSNLERSLYTDDPKKVPIYIYRSTEENPINKPIPARIHIDGSPFARILGGEYMEIYLSSGQHEIKVEYYRDCELKIPVAVKTIILKQDQALYLEVVPGFGVMTWIFCSPFQLVPFPMIGSTVELFVIDEEDALKHMGKVVDEELLKVRRISR